MCAACARPFPSGISHRHRRVTAGVSRRSGAEQPRSLHDDAHLSVRSSRACGWTGATPCGSWRSRSSARANDESASGARPSFAGGWACCRCHGSGWWISCRSLGRWTSCRRRAARNRLAARKEGTWARPIRACRRGRCRRRSTARPRPASRPHPSPRVGCRTSDPIRARRSRTPSRRSSAACSHSSARPASGTGCRRGTPRRQDGR